MKKTFLILVIAVSFWSCKKDSDEKINIHITNSRANTIKVEFRAGSTVCSGTYVPANNTMTDEAFPGEYDVYVSNWNGTTGTDGPFVYHSHGLYYADDKYLTIN